MRRDPYLIAPGLRGWRRLRMELWNATFLVLQVDRAALRRGWRPSRRYRFAYRNRWACCDLDTYALPGLHLLLRAAHWWRSHRWDAERWLLARGIMDLPEEGGYMHDARFVDVPAAPRDRTRSGLVLVRWRRSAARRRELQRREREAARERATAFRSLLDRARLGMCPAERGP